jgi:hypothetical protein
MTFSKYITHKDVGATRSTKKGTALTLCITRRCLHTAGCYHSRLFTHKRPISHRCVTEASLNFLRTGSGGWYPQPALAMRKRPSAVLQKPEGRKVAAFGTVGMSNMLPQNQCHNVERVLTNHSAATITTNRYEYSGSFCDALLDYTASPACWTAITNYSLHAFEFEKKICRASFKKYFGQNLPSPGKLEMNFGLLDINPTHDSSRWKKKNKSTPKKMDLVTNTDPVVKPCKLDSLAVANLCFKSHYGCDNNSSFGWSVKQNHVYTQKAVITQKEAYGFSQPVRRKKMDKSLIHSGIQYMSSDWILEGLIQQIRNKRSVRAVMNAHIRDAEILFNSLRSACPVMGVRITASGRLGKKKKGMAQLQSLSIGKVPLGTFCRKVDYSQGFVITKFGLVGLKVWVAFR